jgi:hypothetical protein
MKNKSHKNKVLAMLFIKFSNKNGLTMQNLFHLHICFFYQTPFVFSIKHLLLDDTYQMPFSSSLSIIYYDDSELVMICHVPLFFSNIALLLLTNFQI